MEYPPPATHGCAAADLAMYFHPDTPWSEPWYTTDQAIPPLLQSNSDTISRGSVSIYGDEKTVSFGTLFSDLSVCWFRVVFPMSDPHRVERYAQYLPSPSSLSRELLLEANETYGETVAAFAESFLGSGQFCDRGEGWDLANKALKYFDDFDYIPIPVPSVNRTHGHLIYAGKAMGKNKQIGRWRGGDDRVRRGDIVEWKSARINFVNSYVFGDFTAIITQDAVPSRGPSDGMALLPKELISLEVVEQSTSRPPEPSRNTYDLSEFEQGEMYIYRPVSLQAYLGIAELQDCPPTGLDTIAI